MAAPVVASVGSQASGTSSCSPTVPAGIAAGDIVLLFGSNLSGSSVLTSSPNFAEVVAFASGNPSIRCWWKRATGAESGTYDVHGTALQNVGGFAMRITGADPGANPFGEVDSDTIGSNTVGPALSLSNAVVDALILHGLAPSASRSFTPETGYTRDTPDTSHRIHVAHKVQTATGPTGTVDGGISSAAAISAVLLAINPAATQDGAEWNGTTEGDVNAFEWNGTAEVALSAFEWNGTTEVPLN